MTHPEQVLRSAKERETVNGAVRALRSAAPDGWERLDFEFRATVGIDSASFEVEDAESATKRVADEGIEVIAPPTLTPWNSLNSRLAGPAGLQLTLFEELGEKVS